MLIMMSTDRDPPWMCFFFITAGKSERYLTLNENRRNLISVMIHFYMLIKKIPREFCHAGHRWIFSKLDKVGCCCCCCIRLQIFAYPNSRSRSPNLNVNEVYRRVTARLLSYSMRIVSALRISCTCWHFSPHFSTLPVVTVNAKLVLPRFDHNAPWEPINIYSLQNILFRKCMLHRPNFNYFQLQKCHNRSKNEPNDCILHKPAVSVLS